MTTINFKCLFKQNDYKSIFRLFSLMVNGLAVVSFVLYTVTSHAQNANVSTVSKQSIDLLKKTIPIPDSIALTPEDRESFYANVVRSGIKQEKAKELVKIIMERNKVLSDLQVKMKEKNHGFNVQNPRALYGAKFTQAEKYFNVKISNLLNYTEYAAFIEDVYKYDALDKSTAELDKFMAANPDLNPKQKEELHNLLYNYCLHEFFTTAYFGFDKAIQKVKLGQLRFNFEKKLMSTCKEFGIKSREIPVVKNNNFQWNE